MRTALLSTVACLALLPSAALAQSRTLPEVGPSSNSTGASETAASSSGAALSDAQADTSNESAGQLGDIVVTAQRRSESLQHAAIPVSVVSGADLVASGTGNATGLSQLVPALTVEPSSTGNLIFLRGVGNFTVVPTSDPAIAFNYDGVYVGRPTSTTGAFYDLTRIEVLKGPQGTLYGRNATGGAINVIPEHPDLGVNSGYATVSYGNYNALTAEGAVNVALGDEGAARLSGTIARHDGYLADGTSDEKTEGLRFQMMGRLTDTLTVRVASDYAHNGGNNFGVSYTGKYTLNKVTNTYQFVPSGIPLDQGLSTAEAQAFREGVFVPAVGRRLDPLSPQPFLNNRFFGSNAEVTWDTQVGTLTFIPAWRYSKLDYLADATGFLYRQSETDQQYSGELRFNGHRIGILDYIVGAYYYHESEDYSQVVDPAVQSSWTTQGVTTSSYAPFGQITAHLTDRLRLVGGIRYTHDHKTFVSTGVSGRIICNATTPAGAPNCPNAPLFPLVSGPSDLPFAFPGYGSPPIPLPGTGAIVQRGDTASANQLTNQRTTYKAAVEFDLAPRSLLYASVETGFRSGGFSAAEGHETYQPEYITAYTLGVKNRFLDNRLQLNIEGFLWNYRNQQVNHVGLDSTGKSANFTDNIGSSRIYGAEMDASALVTRNTLLSADIQYLHAQNESFVYTTGAQAPPLVGCPYTLSGAVYVINCSGFPANNAPRWTANLAAQQTIPVGQFKVVLRADTQYKSSHYINFYYLSDGGGFVDGTWQSNAQISIGPDNGTWSLAFYVKNIEDHRTPVFMGPAPQLNVTVVGTTAPRTFGGRFSVKF